MPGFVNSISNSQNLVFADNADFSGNPIPSEANGLQLNGQIWLGQTSPSMGETNVQVMQLTEGSGINIAYDFTAKTATFSATGVGFTWNSVTNVSPINPIQIVKENGYICNGSSQVQFTLPLSPSIGDTFIIISNTATFQILENGSQTIRIGSAVSTATSGNLTSNTLGDSVEIIYVGSNAFLATAPQGTLTLN